MRALKDEKEADRHALDFMDFPIVFSAKPLHSFTPFFLTRKKSSMEGDMLADMTEITHSSKDMMQFTQHDDDQ